MSVSSDLVWYVSYGSNMCRERFSCYLSGGTPSGSGRTYLGARDKAPARADVEWQLPGQVVFAGKFFVWDPCGCGAAFYLPDSRARSVGRAWLITRQQFMDVVSQENGGEAGDMDDVLAAVFDAQEDRVRIGSGSYSLMVACGERDGVRAWTFTTSIPWEDLVLNRPSDAYLRMLQLGVEETTGVTAEEACRYLAGLPGSAGVGGAVFRG